MGLPCFNGAETIKQVLFTRSKFNFLHVDIQFDVPECKFGLKNSSLKCWMRFRLILRPAQKQLSVMIS